MSKYRHAWCYIDTGFKFWKTQYNWDCGRNGTYVVIASDMMLSVTFQLHSLSYTSSVTQPQLHVLSYIASATRPQLHSLSNTASATQPQLHSFSYTASVTQPQLHSLSYTTSVTQPQLHSLSYTTSATQPQLHGLRRDVYNKCLLVHLTYIQYIVTL